MGQRQKSQRLMITLHVDVLVTLPTVVLGFDLEIDLPPVLVNDEMKRQAPRLEEAASLELQIQSIQEDRPLPLGHRSMVQLSLKVEIQKRLLLH